MVGLERVASQRHPVSDADTWLVLPAGVLTVTHICLTYTAGIDSEAGYLAGRILCTVIGALAVLLAMLSACSHQRRGRGRVTWVFVATSFIASWAGDMSWAWLGVYHEVGKSPAWTDIAYLASWLFFALAIALEHSHGVATGQASSAALSTTLTPAAAPTPVSTQAPMVAPAPATPEISTDSRPGIVGRHHVLSCIVLAITISILLWVLRGSFVTAEGAAAVAALFVIVLVMVRQILVERDKSPLWERQIEQVSEEQFQRVLRRTKFSVDSASDWLLWLDNDGWVVDSNESARRALEYSAEEISRLRMSDIDPLKDTNPEVVAREFELTRTQKSRSFESVYRTKSGRILPVEITVNYMEYEGERLICSFARDISNRKQAEQVLRETEAQLRQLQKMDAIGQLAGGIAHDFSNLLTAILSYSEMILTSDYHIDGQVREDVREIKSAAQRAAALTQQILSFSRRKAIQPQVTEINAIVINVERLLNRTIGEHIELIKKLDPQAGWVKVDPIQFEQVITNLAVNARDAMPQGGRLIIETTNVELDENYCRRHPGVESGPHVLLAVSDTGAGMDEETKAHAFEPFFTTKEPSKGTGIGLATVYSTVRQSAGVVTIHSVPGYGTKVQILLPREEEPADRVAVETIDITSPNQVGGSSLQNSKRTILVVEDETGIRELIKRVLESHSYNVIQAAEANAALAILQEDSAQNSPQVDMLITDVILPGPIQGGELALRALALRPGLPLLYMSGYTRDIILHSGRLQGEIDLLEKPFTPDTLTKRVREVFERIGSATSE